MPDDYDGLVQAAWKSCVPNVERSGQVGRLVADNYRSSIILVPLLDTDSTGKRLEYGAFSRQLEQLRGSTSRIRSRSTSPASPRSLVI